MFRTLLTISLLSTSFAFHAAHAESDPVKNTDSEKEKEKERIEESNKEEAKAKIKHVQEEEELYY